jgi:signal peptidase I
LGDNRGGSNDGHVWGYLPEKNVLGKISFRVAPLNRAGFLREAPVGEERDGER